MKKSSEEIKSGSFVAGTRAAVSVALTASRDESRFRSALRDKGIDLVLRRNDEGRLYGVTFIDHNSRTVLKGSVLGKEFSANALTARFVEVPKQHEERRENIKSASSVPSYKEQRSAVQSDFDEKQTKSVKEYDRDNSLLGNLFSILTPEMDLSDNRQPKPIQRKKKRRKYGRQV